MEEASQIYIKSWEGHISPSKKKIFLKGLDYLQILNQLDPPIDQRELYIQVSSPPTKKKTRKVSCSAITTTIIKYLQETMQLGSWKTSCPKKQEKQEVGAK